MAQKVEIKNNVIKIIDVKTGKELVLDFEVIKIDKNKYTLEFLSKAFFDSIKELETIKETKPKKEVKTKSKKEVKEEVHEDQLSIEDFEVEEVIVNE